MNRLTGARVGVAQPGDSVPVPRATLLTTSACHLCEDAHQELSRRAERGELSLEVVPADSEQGRRVIAEHRPAMLPLVLLGGRVLGHGRLSRRRLDAALQSRQLG